MVALHARRRATAHGGAPQGGGFQPLNEIKVFHLPIHCHCIACKSALLQRVHHAFWANAEFLPLACGTGGTKYHRIY